MARANKQAIDTVTYVHPVVKVGKWVLDKISALIGLFLTLLLFPFIVLAIKLDSKGPIFYVQQRVGRQWPNYTELINVIKFRTMVTDAEKDGAALATKGDARITRFGLFMRKTRIDELPQLLNVLKGDMSLVGPRPERPVFIAKIESQIPFFSERVFGVLPGLTGMAQVSLGYDESIEDVRKKVAFDHAYSLVLAHPLQWLLTDLRIIFMTVWVVINRRGQ